MLRWLILLFFSLLFARCNDMMQEAIKNVVQETHRKDSANERIRDYPISMDRYKIIERKKEGKDSLYIVRRFLLTGEKYCDISYRNNFMNGRAKFYYKSGQLSHVFIYQNDTVVTLNECYSPSGEKRPGTFAVRGTGLIQIFHPITHKLIYEYTLKNKLKHGRYLAWYENGNKAVECELDRDTLVNYYRGWYKTGALEMERKENKTTKLVTFFTYFPDNKIKRIEAWKNYQKQFIKEYDVEGRVTEDESITADNKLKGKKYYYGAKGQLLSRGSYIEGKKDGPYEYFYDNGNKKAIETYLEDVLL
ncbi:MAG: hypothetical protein ACXVNM_12710, partial [Bacteroidia bacterium]